MTPELRDRVIVPVLGPLALIVYFLGVSFALAQIMLALPELGATILLFVLAGLALVATALLATRSLSTPAIVGGLATALAVVLGAGTVAAAAGPREELAPEVAAPADEALFVAVDTDFEEAPTTLPAGEHEFVLENRGTLRHDVTIAELGDLVVVEARGGETETGTVELDPGEYYFYCSRADHEERGMFGTLEVTD